MNSHNQTWLEIRELAEALFCSVKSVYIYRDKNLFRAGTHYYYYSVGEGKQIRRPKKGVYALDPKDIQKLSVPDHFPVNTIGKSSNSSYIN